MREVALGDLIEPSQVRRAGSDNYPILSMTMHEGLIDQSAKFKKRVASDDLSDYKVVTKGQLVVGFPIDEGVLDFQTLYTAGIVSPAYGVWDLTDTSRVHIPYLKRFLRSSRALTYYKTKLRGSTARRRSLPAELFLALPVPLPTLEKQQQIAEILERADTIRAERREILAHLEALTQSIFHYMFERATKPKWPVRPVGDIAEARLGKMLDAKQQTGRESRPYLRNANVKWFYFDLDDLLTMDFNERERKVLALRPGDVLVCEGGEPGRCAVWRGELEECYFQKALHRLRLDKSVDPTYFVRAVRSIVDQGGLKDYVTSSTIAHLTGEKLRGLPIPVPPFELQREFAIRAQQVESQRVVVQRALDADDELFTSLLSRAFRGEL